MILARGVQGIGGGGLLSLWQAILGNLVAVKERGTYQTWFSISWGLAWYNTFKYNTPPYFYLYIYEYDIAMTIVFADCRGFVSLR